MALMTALQTLPPIITNNYLHKPSYFSAAEGDLRDESWIVLMTMPWSHVTSGHRRHRGHQWSSEPEERVTR